jgi:hypothetical protein
MILGLPIDGTPVCGMVSSGGCRDSVGHAIGLRPQMSQGIKRIGRRRACIPGGSRLTSTPARRVLRTPSFRGMFGFVFQIYNMTSNSLVT